MSSKRTGKKRFVVYVAVFAMAAVLLISPIVRQVATAARDTYESLEVFANIIHIVQKHYIDDIPTEDLIEGAIEGMMSSLDPHSAYLTPELYRELQVDTRGTFGGLGIEITVRDDVLTIITPLADTPAARAGVKPGDQIVKIDGKLTKGMSLMEAVSLMRGPKGTPVTLTLVRESSPQLIDVDIVREIIKVTSVKDLKVLEDRYGYVRVTQFQEATARELEEAITQLADETPGDLEGLVLDLRHNPGGLLNEAVKVSDLFLDSGLIVYTEGRSDNQEQRFLAHHDGTEPNRPMVVLVDEGSASASEIVAGALQDHKRAVLVGTQTFGKGSVQTILPLDRDSALRLTTARYFTPSGRSIQATGIRPDVIVERAIKVASAADHAVRERDLAGHIDNPNSSASDAGPGGQLAGDPQLERALDLLKTWHVFSRFQDGRGVGLHALQEQAAGSE